MLIFEKISQIKIESQLSQLPFEQKTEGDILHLEVILKQLQKLVLKSAKAFGIRRF